MDPRRTYRVDWFDTWSGLAIVSADPTAVSRFNPDAITGMLEIPLPQFPTTNAGTIVGDGNDIALRIHSV